MQGKVIRRAMFAYPVSTKTTRVLRWVLEADGFGVGFFGRLFAKIYRGNLEKAIPLFVSEIEGNRVPV